MAVVGTVSHEGAKRWRGALQRFSDTERKAPREGTFGRLVIPDSHSGSPSASDPTT